MRSPKTVTESRRALKPRTVKARWAMARGFFRDLRASGQLRIDPFETVKPPRVKAEVLDIRMSFQEAERIISQIPSESWYGARLRLILLLGLHAGGRLGDILRLNWGDIDLVTARVTFLGKGGKERVAGLTPFLVSELTGYRKRWGDGQRGLSGAPVFVGRKGNRLAAKAIYPAIERFHLRSEYGVHPHLMRHLFTTCAAKVVALHEVSSVTGHASVAAMEPYLHPEDKAAGIVAAAVSKSSSLCPQPVLITPSSNSDRSRRRGSRAHRRVRRRFHRKAA